MAQEKLAPQEWARLKDENTKTLAAAIDELARIQTANQRGERNHRELREHIHAVQELFRTLKPTHREQHQLLWGQFNSIRGQVRKEQEEFKQRQEDNARQLQKAIEHLESSYNIEWLAEIYRDGGLVADDVNFPEIYEHMDRVQELFKELRPIRKDDHDRLWNRFNQFHGAVQNSKKKRRERQEDELNENRRIVENALHDLKISHQLTFFDDLFSTNRTLKGFWSASREVADLIRETRLRKEDRQKLWQELNNLRDKANAIKEQLDEAWKERHRDNIAYKRSLIEKNGEFIDLLRSRIEENEERRDNARSPDFADTVQGWIDESDGKIRDVENRNRELEQQIEELERKL